MSAPAATIVVESHGRFYRKRAIDRAQALAMGAASIGTSAKPAPAAAAGTRGRGRPASTKARPGGDGSSTSMVVPRKMAGRIIGRGGTSIKRVRDESGAGVSIKNAANDTAVVSFRGSPDAIAAAMAKVRLILDDDE